MDIIKKIEDFIKNAHAGQKRWDGSDYFETHLKGVRDIALEIYGKDGGYSNLIEIIAMSHDLAEDTSVSEDDFGSFLSELGLFSEDVNDVVKALKLLNKNNYDSYLDFVLGAKSFWLARIVKRADITHNLSDLKKGSMRDKYMLAKYILEH